MPSVPSANLGPMSNLTWGQAKARIAGVISLARDPDALAAAGDALSEVLQDWDTVRDWRFTQTIAPDIDILADGTTDSIDLPSAFKKPYVAYLNTSKRPLFYIERANWHRQLPAYISRSIPEIYTIYDAETRGKMDLWPLPGIVDTLTVLYYRPMVYINGDAEALDIPARWEGYIMAGAKAILAESKSAGDKSMRLQARYEAGLAKAKRDDLRVPDQFLQFSPPETFTSPSWLNPNSTWQSVVGA